MLKFLLSISFFFTFLFSAEQVDGELVKNHDFLEISKNYMEVHKVHKMKSNSSRTLQRLNNLNFAMKPYVSSLKSFDYLKVHYAYPLKIFLPKGTTVTSATLSNSDVQPNISQNVIITSVSDDFESGLLDITYIFGSDEKNAKFMSIKLEKYVYQTEKFVENNKLYTQAKYYKSKKLDNNEILAVLKPYEYSFSHSQVEYMGIIYDINLISIVKDKKILKKLKDDKYINAGLVYNGTTYNYFITSQNFWYNYNRLSLVLLYKG